MKQEPKSVVPEIEKKLAELEANLAEMEKKLGESSDQTLRLKADFDTVLLNLHIENTSLAFIEFHGKRVRVRGFNDTSHLPRKQRNDHHVS